ncbi:hypothetical protein NIES2111_61900 (plasmid) [Nostoc sp. NIES-2111]|nr:hypothetical protein NIES2111_61900 [Nostoc sp. NIES-2111]
MPVDAKLYYVLIASPGDVKEEREIIREEIHRWNSIHTRNMKIILQSVGWETDATPDLKERGQAVINRQLVDTCDMLIGAFWTRLGTPTPEAESGTVEEIERAAKEGKRCIVYFSDKEISLSGIDYKQYERLQEYKQVLNKRGLTNNYKTLEEFRERVFRHITMAVQDIVREEIERRSAEKEAKITEQAIGLSVQSVQTFQNVDISFESLADAQVSVKKLLESKFGIQDMEDTKEKEIAKIQTVLNSPELASLFNQQPTTESISAITQIIETATTPSMYALAAVGKYGNDSSSDWLEIVGDWVERLSTRKLESGYSWVSYIKTYPGLLLLYALGISALRANNINFLREVTERQIYVREYDSEFSLLSLIHPAYVFYNDTSKLIEPGFSRNYTPVSDHLNTLIKNLLYPNEEQSRYLDCFDLFEFLISLKGIQVCNDYAYFGSFTWRNDTTRFIIKSIQSAALRQGKYGIAISDLMNGEINLINTAKKYDEFAEKIRWDFGRSAPNYVSLLIQLAKEGKKVSSYRELINILDRKS